MAVNTIEFSLSGVDKLSETLKTLKEDVKYKSGRFALRKAANIVADALRAGAERLDDPKTAQSIARNVAVRFSPRRFKEKGDLMFRVGILGGARQGGQAGKSSPGGDTFYWRFLEFGTEQKGARSFARPALERNIGQATNEFAVQFQKSLDRAARRASGGK